MEALVELLGVAPLRVQSDKQGCLLLGLWRQNSNIQDQGWLHD